MRTTISLPDPVFENAKEAALARGISLSELIHEALISQLNRPQPQKTGEFRLPTISGRLVNPNLDLDKISALIAADDEEQYGKLG